MGRQHMLRRKHLRIAAVVLGLSLVAAACGDDDDTGSGDTGGDEPSGEVTTYKIAWVGPLTGPAANLGIFIRDGAKVAVEQFNAEHDDIQIEMEEFDTQ